METIQNPFLEEKDLKEAFKTTPCDLLTKSWLNFAFSKGTLDVMVAALTKDGERNNVGAISYIIKFVMGVKVREDLKWSDFGGSSNGNNSTLLKKVTEFVAGEAPLGIRDKTRVYGSVGHKVIPFLFSGKLIEPNQKFIKPKEVLVQPELFQNGYDYLAVQEKLRAGMAKVNKGKLVSVLVEKISEDWNNIVSEIEEKPDMAPYQSSCYKAFCENMSSVFGEHFTKIWEKVNYGEEYLVSLTLMTWARCLITYKDMQTYTSAKKLVFFYEVPVLSDRYDVGLGTLDALFIRLIDGKPPTSEQEAEIEKMTRRRYSSVGEVIVHIIEKFGKDVHLLVRDWKFAVGDGASALSTALNIIKEDDVELNPLPSHLKQLKRYLFGSLLSYGLATGKHKEDIEAIWKLDSFKISGELYYLFPLSRPYTHSVELTGEEMKESFKEQVVAGFYNARQRAKLNDTTNKVLHLVIDSVNDKGKGKGKVKYNGDLHPYAKQAELELPPGAETTMPISETKVVAGIITHYTEPIFADRYGIVEVLGYKNTQKEGTVPVYGMHINRLLKAIEEKSVDTGDFNLGTGGKICCIMKDHEEKTASMSIMFNGGIFHCFGCGAGGRFVIDSVPKDMHDVIEIGNHKKVSLDDVVISPRHQNIMYVAQKLMQEKFLKSYGARYMREKRGLNPELSLHNGAGYADKEIIIELLQAGFGYDELLYYGLLGISAKISEQSSLVSVLKRHGLTIHDLRRDTVVKEKGKPKTQVQGLPYFILNEKVTYPLEIHEILCNFYGRSTDPNCAKQFKHSKLLTKASGVPPGAYNLSRIIRDPTAKYLLVEEAPINVDTFMQVADLSGGIRAGAVIGTKSALIWDMIALFKGDVIISFNHDKSNIVDGIERGQSGQKKTRELVEYLRASGFQNNIYDFTAGFVEQNPGIEYNDFNGYWTSWRDTRGKVSVLNSMKLIE